MQLQLTIKSYITVFLIILAGVALYSNQSANLLAQLVISVALTAVIDIVINLVKMRKLVLPSSAIISGLFIGSLLPASPLYVVVAASLLAMLSKHVIRVHGRHIFNPAGFGIVIVGVVFSIVPVWWSSASLLSVPLGLFILYKLRKWFLFVSFIVSYYLLLVLQNLSSVQPIFFPDPTLLFFAFFMLTEPLTSTYHKKSMIVQGVLVAVLVILSGTFVRGVDVFLLPLLISNIFVQALNKKLRPGAKTIQQSDMALPIAAA